MYIYHRNWFRIQEVTMGDAQKRDFQFSDYQFCGSKKESNLKYHF